MTNDEIRELIQIVNDSGIAELEVQRGENRVRIRRTQRAQTFISGEPHPAAASVTPPVAAPTPGTAAAAAPVLNDDEQLVKSPIVGTFMKAPRRARRRSSELGKPSNSERSCASSNP